MPRKETQPKYRRHKARDCAVVTIHGKNYYLGAYESPESREKYNRLIAENWRPKQSDAALAVPSSAALVVNQAVLRYLDYAETYYLGTDGKPNHEFIEMKSALAPLKEIYGATLASQFGPLKLKAVREHLIRKGLSRGVVNKKVDRIRRAWRWIESEELVPEHSYAHLLTVTRLRRGHTTARETEPVGPADEYSVDAVIKLLSPPVAAAVRIQRITGMRSCELVIMRLCDIDRSRPIWVYTPQRHKTDYLGHTRTVPLGPQAQKVLQPYLDRDATAYLFSPIEADEWNRKQQLGRVNPNRKTPVYPSEKRAKARRLAARAAAKHRRKRPPGDRYEVAAYRRCISYALKRAMKADPLVKWWHPHQLRHSKGTELRKEHGIEAAAVMLGHTNLRTAELYAQRNLDIALQIAGETG
jgi:integrase